MVFFMKKIIKIITNSINSKNFNAIIIIRRKKKSCLNFSIILLLKKLIFFYIKTDIFVCLVNYIILFYLK